VPGCFIQEDPLSLSAGDLNLRRYVGNDPHNATDPTGTTAAIEYAELLNDIAGKIIEAGDVAEIGLCVCQMIGAAANGLNGVQSGNPAECVGKVFAPKLPIPTPTPGAVASAVGNIGAVGTCGK
jgi:uncharacterized protein RhaS with RHS repeats